MSKFTKTIQTALAAGCSVLALVPTCAADPANFSVLNGVAYSQLKTGINTIPLQISPVQIEAPPRRIDLIPTGQEKTINNQLQTQRLSGFPASLNNYPMLNLVAKSIDASRWGVNLELDSQGKGVADTLILIGDPTLFPEMVDARIDFRSVEFAPKGRVYSLKRKIGLGSDEKWRYTPQNVALTGIANGVVNASFAPGSDLVITKAFDSLEIEKTPWFNYEYNLPSEYPWIVQINAKINIDGLNRDVTLHSKAFKGGGKQKILLNFTDLLNKADPQATGGLLTDLVIHFMLAPSSAAVKDVRIDLGRMEFYRTQQNAQNGGLRKLLFVPEESKPVNLVKKLEHFSFPGELTVVGGTITPHPENLTGLGDIFPEISLQTSYREKLPKLFVGERAYLDDLDGNELSALLDQKLFLEKHVLWKAANVEERPVTQIPEEDLKSGSLTLAQYFPNTRISNSSYILIDYEFDGARDLPVYATLSGTDSKGLIVSFDRLLLKNRPIKTGDMLLNKVTLSLSENDLTYPLPRVFRVKNFEISNVHKSKQFDSKSSFSTLFLERSFAPISAPQPNNTDSIWKLAPERIHSYSTAKEGVQTIKSYSINRSIQDNSYLLADIFPSGQESLYISVIGKNKSGKVEQLFPCHRRCFVKLSKMDLLSIDIAVKTDPDKVENSILINKLEIVGNTFANKSIWSMPSNGRTVSMFGSAEMLTTATFNINKKIAGGAFLDYTLEHSSGPAMSYLFRIRGENALGRLERLIPLALEGTLSIPEMTLNSIDLVLLGGDAALISTVQVSRLSLRDANIKGQQALHTIDTSLTYEEILKGQKYINIPITVGAIGEYRFDLASSDTVSVGIDPAFIKQQPTSEVMPPAKSKFLYYIGLFIVAFLLFIFWEKLSQKWLLTGAYPKLHTFGFWLIVISLLASAYYLIFKSGSKDSFSWGSALLVLAYIVAIRWRIRFFLVKKWPYFKTHLSAPYFISSLFVLALCATLLVFNLGAVAEKLATIGYFLLVTGTLVEFMQFSKGGDDSVTNS